MTARGELFVDEDCRDFFAYELDKVFGKGTWILDGTGYSGFNDEAELPEHISVPIRDENEAILGRADIQIKFTVGHDSTIGKFVEAFPKKITIHKVNVDDHICMQCADMTQHSKVLHTKKGCCVPGCGCRMVVINGV